MQTVVIKILLVEDNPGDARLVQLYLAEVAGVRFETVRAERLSEALELLKQQRFDAVLLDLSLPDSQGLETVGWIIKADASVPIVVLSGYPDEGLALRAVQSGAQDYLVKGQSDGQVIARVVRYAMERKRAEEALRQAREELERRVEERTANLKAVNERLQQEIAQRRNIEEDLRQEHRFLSTILDMVGSLVVVLDPDGCIVGFNRACEEVSGYNDQEVFGRPVWEFLSATEEVELVQAVFAELKAGRFPNRHENFWLTRTGARRLISWSNTALVGDDGAVEYIIATGMDITESKQAEAVERRHMLELAHVSRLSTMGEMATEIAHELNQPLTAISNYAKACTRLLNAGRWEMEDLHGALGAVAGQAQRAGEIIRGLRGFVGKEQGKRATLDLNDLVDSMVKLVAVEARWHKVAVTCHPSDGPTFVLGDRILLEQVILNLLRNAIEAMDGVEKDRRTLTILTSCSGSEVVTVTVADTGPGLSPEALEKVFERFYTTKANGMGVGLAICRSIIETHGGRLWASHNDPHGAVFQLSLPSGSRS